MKVLFCLIFLLSSCASVPMAPREVERNPSREMSLEHDRGYRPLQCKQHKLGEEGPFHHPAAIGVQIPATWKKGNRPSLYSEFDCP